MCTLFFLEKKMILQQNIAWNISTSFHQFNRKFHSLFPPLLYLLNNKKTVTDLFSIYCSLPIFFFPSPSYISHRSPAYRTRCITVPLSLVKLAKQMFNRDNEQAQIAFSLVHESFERGEWTRT